MSASLDRCFTGGMKWGLLGALGTERAPPMGQERKASQLSAVLRGWWDKGSQTYRRMEGLRNNQLRWSYRVLGKGVAGCGQEGPYSLHAKLRYLDKDNANRNGQRPLKRHAIGRTDKQLNVGNKQKQSIYDAHTIVSRGDRVDGSAIQCDRNGRRSTRSWGRRWWGQVKSRVSGNNLNGATR